SRKDAAPQMELAVASVDAAMGQQGHREREDRGGEARVEEKLARPYQAHGARKVARGFRSRVAPWEDPRPPQGGRPSSSWRAVRRGRRRTQLSAHTSAT